MKSGTKIKRVLVFLAMLPFVILVGNAQSKLIFYHSNDQFNSSNFNPAFLTSQQKFTFSILPFTGMSISYNNQAIIREMISKVLLGNQTKNDFKDVFNSLVQRGLFYQRLEVAFINLGYNSEFGSFNFRIREVEQLMSNLKGNFSEFLLNESFQTLFVSQAQSFPAEALHYREYSLGYARELIENKLSVGLRFKLYFGKSSALSAVQGELLKENGNYFLETSGSVKLSLPVLIKTNSREILQAMILKDNLTVRDYLMNSKNTGIGLDFGFNYKITPDIEFSASLVDLGKINWKNNLNTMNFKGKYEFPSKFTDTPGAGFLTKNDSFSVSVVDVSPLIKIETDNLVFSTPTPTNFYVGLKYRLNPTLNIGVVNQYIKANGLSHNSFSLTASYELKKNLTVSTGYSMIGNSFTNVPVAILYNWGSGQMYLGTDNFLSFIYPAGSEFTGITFGTCFFLFRNTKKYKKQLEYLPYFKGKRAKSRTSKGLIFNNYPDS